MQGQFKFFFEESKCACGLLIECGYTQDLRYNTDYTKVDIGVGVWIQLEAELYSGQFNVPCEMITQMAPMCV